MTEAEQNRLVIENDELPAKIASAYRGRGVDFEELVRIAHEGLVVASRRYNPSFRTKFSTWAWEEINSHLMHEIRSGKYAPVGEVIAAEWGDEHSERIHEYAAWGRIGNAFAIYEIWPDHFDPSAEPLNEAYDLIRDKKERFEAAFISLKPKHRKLFSLVYSDGMTISLAAREMKISYLKAWRMLQRSISTMREVIKAMENNEKASLEVA